MEQLIRTNVFSVFMKNESVAKMAYMGRGNTLLVQLQRGKQIELRLDQDVKRVRFGKDGEEIVIESGNNILVYSCINLEELPSLYKSNPSLSSHIFHASNLSAETSSFFKTEVDLTTQIQQYIKTPCL